MVAYAEALHLIYPDIRAVLLTPSYAAGNMRLDTEIVRLQQEFGSGPSRVRFTLRAYLIEERTRRVLAWREFESSIASSSEDSNGGVAAANLAVNTVLTELATFSAEVARGVLGAHARQVVDPARVRGLSVVRHVQ